MMYRQLMMLLFLITGIATGNCLSQTKKDNQKDTDENADTELMNLVDAQQKKNAVKTYTIATFKATRVISGSSIENLGAGVLEFRISHRFGELNQGFSTFWGMDIATTRVGLDYGIRDWLMIGLGHSTYQKEYDGFVKIKMLKQTTNSTTPVSVSYSGAMAVQTMPPPPLDPGKEFFFRSRLYYVNQLLIARKFNHWLSLQLTPTFIHYNLVPLSSDPNNIIAFGISGRAKLSQRTAITWEYFYQIPDYRIQGYRNSVSLGLDFETGGHVFQLMFTNATGISERAFISETTGIIDKGGIHFGFNISRVFTIVKHKQKAS